MSTLKVASIRDLSGIGGFSLASGNITANGNLTVSNITINGTMSGSSSQIVPSVSGQSGKFLTTNGSTMSWTDVSSENISSLQVWTGNGTWNRPSGVKYIHIRVQGGGGGASGHGESGASGGYSERVLNVVNISSVGITVGGGGGGTASASSNLRGSLFRNAPQPQSANVNVSIERDPRFSLIFQEMKKPTSSLGNLQTAN